MTKTIYLVSKIMGEDVGGVVESNEALIAFENEEDAKKYVEENKDNKKFYKDDDRLFFFIGLKYEPVKLFSDLKEVIEDE